MELRQLEYFVAVAEELHFTRAARRLFVAQSGMSAGIRSLEKELGAPLFIRSTRRVELTDAGRALLPVARQALAKASDARDAVAAVQGLLRGTLSVGSLQCLGVLDVPSLLARFREKHPGVELRLRHDGTADLIDGVRAGRLDVAFTPLGIHSTEGLGVLPVADEPMVLACGPTHRLVGKAGIRPDDLAGESFVDFSVTWGTREFADRILAAAGVERRVELEVNDAHSVLDLVSLGLGVAIVPAHFEHKNSHACFVPIEDAPSWRIAAVTPGEERVSTAARALLRMVEEAAGRGPGA
ncbi:transcriptional regulator [Wenjunlia tyrosinilytica]|uniref:Transcriptional regulator n=2 Tax=Wenjunlia tyrosinilytica TaxID=1544741 RepID=A0A917ZSA9_9ACTN|nr:transcriptional regulator [Wenjunlia tyrosinilytica]